MRNLTEEMGHLSHEIARSHDERDAFVHSMKENVATMLGDFDHVETAMANAVRTELHDFHKAFDRAAKQMENEREDFVEHTRDTVTQMLADFDKTRSEMAAEERNNLESFVGDLEHNVGSMRHAFANDMAGARRAWMRHRQLFGRKAPHQAGAAPAEMKAAGGFAAAPKKTVAAARRRRKHSAAAK